MITQKQWEAHPSFQADLAAIMKQEAMVVALEVCISKAMTHIPCPAGADLVNWQAMIGSKREGCFETIQFLRNLAAPANAQLPGMKPWESEKPADAEPEKK